MTRRSVAFRLLRLAAPVIVAAVVVPFLPAQEGPQGETAPVAVFAPLAPPVPAPRNELDLLLNAPESTTPPGSDLEVIRYGHGGSTGGTGSTSRVGTWRLPSAPPIDAGCECTPEPRG